MTTAALDKYDMNAFANVATYLPTGNHYFDELIVSLHATFDVPADLSQADAKTFEDAAQAWLKIKRDIVELTPTDGPETARLIAELGHLMIGNFMVETAVCALAFNFMDSRPDPKLSQRTQTLVNRTNTAANQAIADARKHGAPAHWSGQAPLHNCHIPDDHKDAYERDEDEKRTSLSWSASAFCF